MRSNNNTKIDKINVNKIIKNFEKYKFTNNIGLTETKVLIRNHKTD